MQARNGYLWLLERSADKISFVHAEPFVQQNVFTKIDPETGRPTYDPQRIFGIGKRAEFCPSVWGGKDWPPAAYNPQTGYLYIPANENLCGAITGKQETYTPGQLYIGADLSAIELLPRPEAKEHIGELQAWDMNAGKKVWTVNFKSHNWGPVLTTGGGLIFAGGTNDRYFRAFDAKTGKMSLATAHQFRRHRGADLVSNRWRAIHRRAIRLGRRRPTQAGIAG